MRFTYDHSVDAMAVELVPGARSARTRTVGSDVPRVFDAHVANLQRPETCEEV